MEHDCSFNTRLLHGKASRGYGQREILPPVSQVTAFRYESMEELERVFAHKSMGYAYTRIGNPTLAAFEQKISEMEGGAGAICTSSGMSAIMDLIKDYDFILDGTDNFPAKFLINDACVMAKKPLSHAGIIRFKGQLTTILPGEGPCYRCIFKNPPPKDAVPTCRQAGVIGAMAGVIGSLQALEAVKYITGAGDLLSGYLLTYDALKMEFHKIKLPPRGKGCAVCSDTPTITQLVDYEQAACEFKPGE